MSRRRLKAIRKDRAVGTLLGLLGFALLLILGGGAFYVRSLHSELDAKTNCPTTGPLAIHAVLIDRSDPISEQQAQRVRQWAELTRAKSVPATRFDIYTFEGDLKKVLHPIFTICSTERESNPLYQNPEQRRKNYEEKFAKVFDAIIIELLREHTRPTSPIIESLKAAAQTSFGLAGPETLLRVSIISDLVQHSGVTSHLRTIPDFESLSHSINWPSLRPDLRGADVEMLYVLRPKALRKDALIQNRGHQEFWTFLIAASGGQITEFTPF